jgi:integrase
MASLVKQSGRYYLQFYDGSRTPQRKRVALKTSRKRPAQTKRRELEDAYVEGRFDPWTDDPFGYDRQGSKPLRLVEAREAFLASKEQAGRSENTIRTYRVILEYLERSLGSNPHTDRIRPAGLEAFIHDPSVSKATRGKRYRHVRAFFRWCRKRGHMEAVPLEKVAKPRPPKKLPKAVTPDELTRICEAIRERYNSTPTRAGRGLWRIPLFWFMLYSGLRPSEAARLRWKHIEEDEGLIYMLEQKNNTQSTVPLTGKARRVLAELERPSPNAFVFQAPGVAARERSVRWFVENASEAFRTARDQAGVPKEKTLYGLRHGFCTLLAKAGKSAVVIKEAARHSEIETSMKYIHLTNRFLKAELEDAFGG